MSEYPPQPGRIDVCFDYHQLYEDCGCWNSDRKHGTFHSNMKRDCHRVKHHYMIKPGRCPDCTWKDFYAGPRGWCREVMMKQPPWPYHTTEPMKLSEEQEMLRASLLIRWKNEMVKSQVIIAIMKAEAARREAFFQDLSANYAQEGDDIPLAERALFFSPNCGGFDDLLALKEDLNLAKCFVCAGSSEGEGLKMIPCGHTIHYSCFKSWYKHSPSEGIRCGVCERRYTTLEVPQCPLIEWYCSKDVDTRSIIRSSRVGETTLLGKEPDARPVKEDTPLLMLSSGLSQNGTTCQDSGDSCDN